MDTLRIFIARLMAALVAGLCGWLLARYGVDIDKDTQRQLVEALVGVIIPVMLAVYGLVHRVVNNRVNPGDAASSHLAAAEKVQTEQLKAQD